MRTKILLGMATVMLAGCGTLANGGTQTVDVVVKGSPTAFCNFSTSVFRNSGHFPNKVVLERSREPLQAECHGEQNLYKKFEIRPTAQPEATAGNVVNGTTFLGLSYDTLSGGAWAYPDPLIVDFRAVSSGPKEGNWPENTADGPPAAIEAPTPVRMTPVVDEQLNPSLGQRATAKPQIVDAVRIASENPKTAASSKMNPIVSPEDDPAVQKAKAEAKAKEAAAAKKKAEAKKKAAAAAKKKAAEAAAKKKAEEEAKAETLPEAKEEAPTETTSPAAAPAEPAKTETPQPSTMAPTVPPATPPSPPPAVPPAAPTPAAPAPSAPKAQENAAPAAKAEAGAESVDVDKYLTGDGQ